MQDAPLYNVIKKYSEAKARFHMPSHSGVGEGLLFSSAPFDITELDFSDNLLNSNGVIYEAEKLAAKSYGAMRTLFTTQGTTLGLMAMVGMCSARRKKIATLGEMHRSFWNAVKVFGVDVCGFSTIKSLRDNFKDSGSIALFATSPDYFGRVADLDEAYTIAKTNNAIFVVDCAHGAHFPFSSDLPNLPKCDISLCSMHKTMSVYGGGAIINIYNNDLIEDAEYYRNLLHSTSPSYLTLASMDYARARWDKNGEDYYNKILQKVNSIDRVGSFKRLKNDDFSRLVLINEGKDISPSVEWLENKGIFIEGASQDKLILILTPDNLLYVDRVVDELSQFEYDYVDLQAMALKNDRFVKCIKDVEFVDIENSEGRIVAQEICAYPPATPILYCGEIITKDTLLFLKQNKSRLFGLARGKIVVVK